VGEIWIPLPRDPRYLVSNEGRVRGPSGKILKDLGGRYPMVHIGSATDNSYIHSLVLETFVGPCPDGLERLHRDDDPQNNRLSNLYYGTHAENMTMAAMPRGSDHWNYRHGGYVNRV
jgi:hypothetical protein